MGECQQARRSVPADVSSPRPREVGGACRIQVLAGARTRETVGWLNLSVLDFAESERPCNFVTITTLRKE